MKAARPRRGRHRGAWAAGPGAQGNRGPGKRLWVGGADKSCAGHRRPWCRCSLRVSRRAPLHPGAQARFPKERRKATAGWDFWELEQGFCPPHRARPPLSAAPASPLPIFGLLLEEPVPQPRVAKAGPRGGPVAVPCRWPPSPRALSGHLRTAVAASPPLSGRSASFGLQLCCGDEETLL